MHARPGAPPAPPPPLPQPETTTTAEINAAIAVRTVRCSSAPDPDRSEIGRAEHFLTRAATASSREPAIGIGRKLRLSRAKLGRDRKLNTITNTGGNGAARPPPSVAIVVLTVLVPLATMARHAARIA
jgi:hypothetical protein